MPAGLVTPKRVRTFIVSYNGNAADYAFIAFTNVPIPCIVIASPLLYRERYSFIRDENLIGLCPAINLATPAILNEHC